MRERGKKKSGGVLRLAGGTVSVKGAASATAATAATSAPAILAFAIDWCGAITRVRVMISTDGG